MTGYVDKRRAVFDTLNGRALDQKDPDKLED